MVIKHIIFIQGIHKQCLVNILHYTGYPKTVFSKKITFIQGIRIICIKKRVTNFYIQIRISFGMANLLKTYLKFDIFKTNPFSRIFLIELICIKDNY